MQPLVAFSPSISQIPCVNLPNAITVSRLFLTAGFIIFVSWESTWGHITALVLFVVAAASDFLDGWLARKMNLVTPLGKLLDPLADKILVCSAFVFLTAQELCPVWITALIIGREFLVTGLRQIAADKGKIIAADNLGKWKTTLQLALGITCLLWLILDSSSPHEGFLLFLQNLTSPNDWLFLGFLYGALALTLLSGLNYMRKSWHLLLD